VGDAGHSSVSASCPATRWSLVLAAGDSRSPNAEEALEHLCRLYWKPVYGFVRSRSHSPEDALDLTQGFFAHLLESRLIHRADAQLGRFRSYLLGCVKNYISGEKAKALTRKRGGDWKRINLDVGAVEQWLSIAAPAARQPDQIYDYACAVSLLDEALRLLEEECATKDQSNVFAALKPYLQGDAAGPNYAETARALGTTHGTVRVMVHRLRTRYRTVLRSVVAETLSDPLAVEEELRNLRAALGTGRAEL